MLCRAGARLRGGGGRSWAHTHTHGDTRDALGHGTHTHTPRTQETGRRRDTTGHTPRRGAATWSPCQWTTAQRDRARVRNQAAFDLGRALDSTVHNFNLNWENDAYGYRSVDYGYV